jgi:thiamine biosynthesis protein ThiS
LTGAEGRKKGFRRVTRSTIVKILLNGDPYEIADPSVHVSGLWRRLEIDARRVAVEHNLNVLKRTAFDSTLAERRRRIEKS